MVFLPNIALQELLDLFEAQSLIQLCSNIKKYWLENFTFKKAFEDEMLQQIMMQDDPKYASDDFSVTTERDRIVFITQDHPFYKECSKEYIDGLLLRIFLGCPTYCSNNTTAIMFQN